MMKRSYQRCNQWTRELEILRLVVGGNMATASLDTAPVGEADMGDELEDDEEADCYHLNKKSECSLWWWWWWWWP
jgi:hypothetical protein